jgi:hypothetical protein
MARCTFPRLRGSGWKSIGMASRNSGHDITARPFAAGLSLPAPLIADPFARSVNGPLLAGQHWVGSCRGR